MSAFAVAGALDLALDGVDMGGKRKSACVDVKSNGLYIAAAVSGSPWNGSGLFWTNGGGVIAGELVPGGQKFELEIGDRARCAGSTQLGRSNDGAVLCEPGATRKLVA